MAGRFAFNTAIAAVMELINEVTAGKRGEADAGHACASRWRPPPRCCSRSRRTSPPTPTTCSPGERVWEEPWPAADPRSSEADTFELVCQVNGKVRDRVEAPARRRRGRAAGRWRARSPTSRAHVDGKDVVKEIVVPGKLVNVVVRG